MKIGYARVSTQDQNLNLQIDALEKVGCEKIYKEKASGSKANRKELVSLLEHLRPGDLLVIWKLDRLGRSLKHLVDLVALLMEKQVGLKSLNDPIDTSTSQGRLIFNIFASVAEFERDIIRERTLAGLAAARARGRIGGRPSSLSRNAQKTAMATEVLYQEREFTISEICEKLQISKPTLYNYLRYRNVEIGSVRNRKKFEYHSSKS